MDAEQPPPARDPRATVIGATGETRVVFWFDRNTKLIALAVALSAVANLVCVCATRCRPLRPAACRSHRPQPTRPQPRR